MRGLLVEDDKGIAEALVEGLTQGGYAMDHLPSAEAAEAAMALTDYDFALIDLGLPGLDGLSLIRRLRKAGQSLPILILTARDRLEDRVEGLDAGGDDYMLKPFALPELQARIRALVRRSQAVTSSDLRVGDLRLDLASRRAYLQDEPLDLTGREWDALQQLMLASPKVVSKRKLAESLGSWDAEVTPNAVELYVSRLRSKLGQAAVSIRTVRGIGYRLEDSSDAL